MELSLLYAKFKGRRNLNELFLFQTICLDYAKGKEIYFFMVSDISALKRQCWDIAAEHFQDCPFQRKALQGGPWHSQPSTHFTSKKASGLFWNSMAFRTICMARAQTQCWFI